MSDKLNRNKFLLFLLLLLAATSCKVEVYDTEISCPNGLHVLVKFARKDEVQIAIQNAAIIKKRDGSSETYTVIRLKDKRSFKIEKLPPEDALKCTLRESRIGTFNKSYVKQFTGR